MLQSRFFPMLARIWKDGRCAGYCEEAFIDLWKGLKKFEYRSPEEFYGFVFWLWRKRSCDFTHQNQNGTTYRWKKPERMSVLRKNMKIIGFCFGILRISRKISGNFALAVLGGMKLAEVATMLNIDEGTAKVRHFRALAELRERLENIKNNFKFPISNFQ